MVSEQLSGSLTRSMVPTEIIYFLIPCSVDALMFSFDSVKISVAGFPLCNTRSMFISQSFHSSLCSLVLKKCFQRAVSDECNWAVLEKWLNGWFFGLSG